MKTIPPRLQGTDGIRREVALQSAFPGLSPQQVFAKHGVITEEFMERYAFAHARLALKKKSKTLARAFVIGWDPRDPKGDFTEAVVRGVRKAGADAWVIGTAPTPLVPMMVRAKNAAGGFMVTASHNPKDQNGIKIFSDGRGLKPLPEDDERLSKSVLRQGPLDKKSLAGSRIDLTKEALKLFEQFHLMPENSWAADGTFADILLVVDPARGALAKIAASVFRKAGFRQVIEVNAKQDGNVNQLSGVADLEGTALITEDMIEKGGKFSRHKAPIALFTLGKQHKKAVEKGDLRVCGAVFDADGDRFYRLEYDPFGDRLLVLSGDETAFLQAKFLMQEQPDRFSAAAYIHTVESDLNTGVSAEGLGLRRDLSPVGDKWILWKAAHMDLENRLRVLRKRAEYQGTKKDRKTIADLVTTLKILKKNDALDVPTFNRLEADVDTVEHNLPPLDPAVAREYGPPFAVGSEETGHNITTGYLPETQRAVYCGNGLKSALNTFAATQSLFRKAAPKRYFAQLEKPFTPGFKGTGYAYYIDQPSFHAGSAVWKKMKSLVTRLSKAGGYKARQTAFPEDPDMLYLSLTHAATGRPAAVFVRNSGTENKISINLRGGKADEKFLCSLREDGVRLLMYELKNPGHPLYATERALLQSMQAGPLPESRAGDGPEARVLMETGKQGLTELTPEGYRLTGRGIWYLDECMVGGL